MLTENNKVIVIKAEDGFKLTQKADVQLSERLISDIIVLGKYDSIENYKEIPNDEAEILIKQIDDYNKSLQENNDEEVIN